MLLCVACCVQRLRTKLMASTRRLRFSAVIWALVIKLVILVLQRTRTRCVCARKRCREVDWLVATLISSRFLRMMLLTGHSRTWKPCLRWNRKRNRTHSRIWALTATTNWRTLLGPPRVLPVFPVVRSVARVQRIQRKMASGTLRKGRAGAVVESTASASRSRRFECTP